MNKPAHEQCPTPTYFMITRLRTTILNVTIIVFSLRPETHAAGPSDDCFGGALSDDALHCYVLQKAHDEGIIVVDAVYRGGKVLFVYLDQTNYVEVGGKQNQAIREIAQEYPRDTGEF